MPPGKPTNNGIPERLGNFVIAYDKVVNSMLPNDLSINFLPVKAGLIAGENDKQAAEKPIDLFRGGRCPLVQRGGPRCFWAHPRMAGERPPSTERKRAFCSVSVGG